MRRGERGKRKGKGGEGEGEKRREKYQSQAGEIGGNYTPNVILSVWKIRIRKSVDESLKAIESKRESRGELGQVSDLWRQSA
jgi:hypothetical protein